MKPCTGNYIEGKTEPLEELQAKRLYASTMTTLGERCIIRDTKDATGTRLVRFAFERHGTAYEVHIKFAPFDITTGSESFEATITHFEPAPDLRSIT